MLLLMTDPPGSKWILVHAAVAGCEVIYFLSPRTRRAPRKRRITDCSCSSWRAWRAWRENPWNHRRFLGARSRAERSSSGLGHSAFAPRDERRHCQVGRDVADRAEQIWKDL